MKALIALYKEWHDAEPSAGHDAAADRWREKLAAVATTPGDN